LKKTKKHDELIEQALKNAKIDRQLALEAYDKMKNIFNEIDTSQPETMQAVLLIGSNAVELIKSAGKSNDQIIKLAAIKEKEDARTEEEDPENVPITLEDIQNLKNVGPSK
jgi:hypothetical protein